MKKSLVALAVLAAAGSAFAQSSVTISGQLDAGIQRSKNAVGQITTTEAGGIHGASRLRFVGIEDLGGGNKANFLLEMQPNLANGTTGGNNTLFNRGAWLGLSGGWGEARLGRQGTASIGLICAADLLGCYSGFSGGGILFSGFNGGPAGVNSGLNRWVSANPSRGQNATFALAPSTGQGTTGADATRVINGVTYMTPSLGGVTAQLQYAFGGQANGQANGNGSSLGVNATYSQGPITAGYTFQSAAADAAYNGKGRMHTLGGAYDLGVARLGAIYQVESNSGAAIAYSSARAWALTAAFPVGAALPYVKVGQHRTNGFGNYGIFNGTDATIVNIGSRYALSKRTNLYADYAIDSKGNSGKTGFAATAVNPAVNYWAKPSIMSVGIQHNF